MHLAQFPQEHIYGLSGDIKPSDQTKIKHPQNFIMTVEIKF